MKTVKWDDLTGTQKRLVTQARTAARTAYCPYSGFQVGAALLTRSGAVITGSNVENAAYGSTICAERAALVRANAMGRRKFAAIAVLARRKDGRSVKPVAPCGACRQMLFEAAEAAKGDIEVIMSSSDKRTVVLSSVRELLPMAFGPKSPGRPAR